MSQEEDVVDEEDQLQRAIEYKKEARRKGVCYLSRIPPYMSPNHIRKLLKQYNVERVYLMPEDQSIRKHRVKTGGNKRVSYTEGWVEFSDKKVARMVAEALNCQNMVDKKGSFYSNDLWSIKYLPKFKWENLTAKLAYDERVRRERLKFELKQDQKTQEFYNEKAEKGREVQRVIRSKKIRGKKVYDSKDVRNFKQLQLIPEADT